MEKKWTQFVGFFCHIKVYYYYISLPVSLFFIGIYINKLANVSKFYLHSIAETEELKQKRINGSYQDLSKLTAETEFRGNGNRINGGESVLLSSMRLPRLPWEETSES